LFGCKVAVILNEHCTMSAHCMHQCSDQLVSFCSCCHYCLCCCCCCCCCCLVWLNGMFQHVLNLRAQVVSWMSLHSPIPAKKTASKGQVRTRDPHPNPPVVGRPVSSCGPRWQGWRRSDRSCLARS
jgi:hypothetical protein